MSTWFNLMDKIILKFEHIRSCFQNFIYHAFFFVIFKQLQRFIVRLSFSKL